MSIKAKPILVTIDVLEGGWVATHSGARNPAAEEPQEFTSWREADAYLHMARPRDMQVRGHPGFVRPGYNKANFRVEYDDGSAYEGRYDVGAAWPRSELQERIRSHLRFMAGLRRPRRMSEAQYENAVTEKQKAAAQDFIASHDLDAPLQTQPPEDHG